MRTRSVVVALLWVAPVWGQAPTIFYDDFETGGTSGWWAAARVGETGQTTCYDAAGDPALCAGTGQDGDLRPGVAWPNPRFVDNLDGTVTDMLTGLVWLKNASCLGSISWPEALAEAAALASGACDLADGSLPGDWRVPTVRELECLLHYGHEYPAVPNTTGTGQWSELDAFSGISSEQYWSSTTFSHYPTLAWHVNLGYGPVMSDEKSSDRPSWPVRSGAWAPARVGRTGQTTCYDEAGAVAECAGTGQDGDLRAGVEWPVPRFADNSDGTVTDMLTGLVWLRQADCFNGRDWPTVMADIALLGDGTCGLSDSSSPGSWRLPTVKELRSLVSHEHFGPALSNSEGTGAWADGDPFVGVGASRRYWSSTSSVGYPEWAWALDVREGTVFPYFKSDYFSQAALPVRGGG